MQSEIMFAGFGGQGILLIGKVLAHAAMEEGFEVAWVPSYGPEMRGGTAYCTVVISDRPIGSPIIKNPMHLVAMNGPSLEKFAPTVKKDGIIFVNSSLISFGAKPGRCGRTARSGGGHRQGTGHRQGRQHRGPFRLRGQKRHRFTWRPSNTVSRKSSVRSPS